LEKKRDPFPCRARWLVDLAVRFLMLVDDLLELVGNGPPAAAE
jgi:hypothetical protein